MKKKLIYTCMNTNKAWRLNISTAAQWNSGLENLLTSITVIHLLQTREKQKEKMCCLREELKGITLAASLRCHHIYRVVNVFWVFSFLSHWERSNYSTNWRETFMNETDECSGGNKGFADWYLHVNPGQTWGHFPAFFFVVVVVFVCFRFALKPKMHSL